jgi:hypothetical protein
MRVTKEHITFNIRRWSTFKIVLGCLFALPNCSFVVLPPYLEFWQVTCLYISNMAGIITGLIWISLTRSLRISAEALSKCFKVSLCYSLYNISEHYTYTHIEFKTSQYIF